MATVPSPEDHPLMDSADIAAAIPCSIRKAQRLMSDGTWPEMMWVGKKRVVPTAAFRRWAGMA